MFESSLTFRFRVIMGKTKNMSTVKQTKNIHNKSEFWFIINYRGVQLFSFDSAANKPIKQIVPSYIICIEANDPKKYHAHFGRGRDRD